MFLLRDSVSLDSVLLHSFLSSNSVSNLLHSISSSKAFPTLKLNWTPHFPPLSLHLFGASCILTQICSFSASLCISLSHQPLYANVMEIYQRHKMFHFYLSHFYHILLCWLMRHREHCAYDQLLWQSSWLFELPLFQLPIHSSALVCLTKNKNKV